MSTKLYPPQIAGALPAFCKTYDILQDLSVGARITIPFVMNAGVDLPILLGEYHCGALDRGLTATGLKGVENQMPYIPGE